MRKLREGESMTEDLADRNCICSLKHVTTPGSSSERPRPIQGSNTSTFERPARRELVVEISEDTKTRIGLGCYRPTLPLPSRTGEHTTHICRT